MDVDINNLSDDLDELKEIIIDQNEKITQLYEKIKNEYEKKILLLFEELKYWKDKIFGRKTEKYQEDETQQTLFGNDEIICNQEETTEEVKEIIEIPAHTRNKKRRQPLPKNLPRVEVIIDIDEKDIKCLLGENRKFMGYEITEKLEIKPAELTVIQYKRAKYGCPAICIKCTENKESPVKIAKMNPNILPKTVATPSLLAYIITSKFCDHLPFYRLEKILDRWDITFSRQTMCNWIIKSALKCKELIDMMWQEVLSNYLIGVDETTVQVINERGRDPTTKSYIWAFKGGDSTKPIILFNYRETRSGAYLLDLLKDFKGVIQCDAFKGYDALETLEGITLVGCWAHARRKFKEAEKIATEKGVANIVLNLIKKLYIIESETKDIGLDERKQIRQEQSKPILVEIKKILDKEVLLVLPKCLLGKAINYTLNIWDKLIRYVDDGSIPIDNNAVENTIRPFCLGRKNWLFFYSPGGAHAGSIYYSLIETAKANYIEPYSYLKYIFEKIPYASTSEDFLQLLPQYIDRSKIKSYKIPEKCG